MSVGGFFFLEMQNGGLTRVATNPEVTAGVHAEVVVGEVALHSHLEAVDVGMVGDELVYLVSFLSVVAPFFCTSDQRQTHS
jgi:hypothetical protein